MKIKYLIFDLDDTLVNDTENRRGAFMYTLEKLNLPYTEEYFQKWLEFDADYWQNQFQSIEVPEEYKKTGDMNAEYLRGSRFPIFFGKDKARDPLEMQKIFKEGLTKRIVPMPGVVDTIKKLAKKYPVYIATNGDINVANCKIQQIGLKDDIKSIFSADMTLPATTKADTDYYEQLLKKLNNPKAEECLMIGDNYRDDIINPHKLGFKTCWIWPKDDKQDDVSDYQIENIKELLDFL